MGDMISYTTDDKVSEQDLLDMFALDSVNFSHLESLSPVEQLREWLGANPDFYTILRDQHGKLVGYISFIPLKTETYEKFRTGKITDTDITANDILAYKQGEVFDALFNSLNICKKHHNGRAFKILVNAFIQKTLERQARGIMFGRVLADCVTDDGKRLVCRVGETLPYKSHTQGAVLKEATMADILKYHSKKAWA